MLNKEIVIDKLKEIIDPELGIDIVALGLIREVQIGEYLEDFGMNESLKVIMTLTTPMCPFADVIIQDVQFKLQEIYSGEAEVELSFDPPWTASPQMRMALGL